MKEIINAQETLADLIKNGILSSADVHDAMRKNLEQTMQRVHNFSIWEGTGQDKRWFTYVPDNRKRDGRRKIGKRDKQELLTYLCRFYSLGPPLSERSTLKKVYKEWVKYKAATANRLSTVQRLDQDYKKYYIREPLSREILNKPLQDLTVADIKAWAYALTKKYSFTKKAYFNATTILRQVFDYMIEQGLLTKNTCKMVKLPDSAFRKNRKKPAQTQIFYPDEVSAILSYCNERAMKENALIFLTLPIIYYCGLRIGECLALAFEDFDRAGNTLYVHSMLTIQAERNPDGSWKQRRFAIEDYLKGNGDPREVLISDACFETVELIKKLHHRKEIQSEYLFPNITESGVQSMLYRACDKLGFERRSPHKWRKTYISVLLNNGVDIDFIRSQVGHKEIQTTLNSYSYSTSRKCDQLKQLEKCLLR